MMIVGYRSCTKSSTVPHWGRCTRSRHEARRCWWSVVTAAVRCDAGQWSAWHINASVADRAYNECLYHAQCQARWRRRCQLWWPCTKIWGTQETQIDFVLTRAITARQLLQYYSVCIFIYLCAVWHLQIIMLSWNKTNFVMLILNKLWKIRPGVSKP